MTRVLDEESINGNSLIFYSRQTWVEVYIDDELLVEFVENEDVSVKMTPGSYWHFFRLPEDYDGKTLKIVFTPVINRYAGELPIIYAGTKTAIVYMVFSQGNVSILLVLPVLFWGIGLCCIGIFSNQRVIRQKLCRLGLFAIATGIWSLLESRVIQMFFGNVAVLSYLLFSCYYLIPVLTASFLLTFVTLGKRRYIRGLFWIAAAFFVVVQLLQITNTAYYIQMVPVAHVLFVFIILSVIVSYIDLQRKKENIPDKSIYRAAILLGIFCVIDMITYYVYPVMIVGSFSKVGFLLFFAYLGHSALRQICKMEIQDAENRVYQQLAYVDMMTGLSNRTAFERELALYREQPWEETTILLISDVNRLKFINDTYGHVQGDGALIQIAKLLQENFKQRCKCYRIGGDEFAVISRGIAESKFSDMCRAFQQSVRNSPQEEDWDLSVSCGYHVLDDSGIDEGYKKADANMYAEKLAYRESRKGLS